MTTTVLCVLFNGEVVPSYSSVYSPEWVDKLYRGFKRHSTLDFRFLCLTDKNYVFTEGIEQIRLRDLGEGWMCINEIFRPDLGVTNGLFLGLDSVITGNVDHLLGWRGDFGLIRSPYDRNKICNGVLSFSRHSKNSTVDRLWSVWNSDRTKWRKACSRGLGQAQIGYPSEVVFLRKHFRGSWVCLDDLWPGHFLSYKAHVLREQVDTSDARIVYFHGDPKPPNIPEQWILDNWS